MGVSLTNDRFYVDLLEPSSNPQIDPPYLKAMWLLWKVPICMYVVKKLKSAAFDIVGRETILHRRVQNDCYFSRDSC